MPFNQDEARRLLIALADPTGQPPDAPSRAAGPAPAGEDALLDAYSRAVIGVVERVSAAVIAVGPPRGAQGPGGSGSGFLLTPDGFAVTNSHVIGGRQRLSAMTHEGDLLDAELIGDDPATDLALIRVAARELPVVELGDSDGLRVGQLVVALGSPFGLQSTVSSGIVSATRRSMRGVGARLIEGVVQHTAPINPGNSGGPLVDTLGRVVGVNTATIAFAQGLGFAVPANTARLIVSDLISYGRVRRAVLGIGGSTVPIPRRIARDLDLLNETGVRVESLEPGAPAQRAGLEAADVIVGIDGRIVGSVDDLHRFLMRVTPGATITLLVVRDARRIELPVMPVASH